MKEIWKDIKDFEGIYKISNKGRIKSLKRKHVKNNKILKPLVDKDGYYMVTLKNNGQNSTKKIHRLVAENFIKKETNKFFVNHKDGNKQNNCVTNLEWCTRIENMQHALKNNLIKTKPIYQYDLKGNLIKKWKNIIEIREKCKFVKNTTPIYKCCAEKQRTAYKFIWKYY